MDPKKTIQLKENKHCMWFVPTLIGTCLVFFFSSSSSIVPFGLLLIKKKKKIVPFGSDQLVSDLMTTNKKIIKKLEDEVHDVHEAICQILSGIKGGNPNYY